MSMISPDLKRERPIVTVEQHILQEQRRFPGASGEFSWLLSGITLATKIIQAKIRRAGLTDILGSHGDVNIQGEMQQKLDVYANETLLECLSYRESIALLASEENETPIMTQHNSPHAKYAVVFDPLDGSSNIDVNVSVGTTFSILKRPANTNDPDPTHWVLQPGGLRWPPATWFTAPRRCLSTAWETACMGLRWNRSVGDYLLSHENMRMPQQGKYYSVNEALRDSFPPGYICFLDRLRCGALGHNYVSRTRFDGVGHPPHADQGRCIPLPTDTRPRQRQIPPSL